MAKNKNIVLLVGKIGSGKTTATELLVKNGYEELTFAEPIKKFALSLGFTHEQCYGTQAQKAEINQFWSISGRQFFEKFGNEIGKVCIPQFINLNLQGRSIWIRNCERKLQDLLKENKKL